jgi:hypothetical protein
LISTQVTEVGNEGKARTLHEDRRESYAASTTHMMFPKLVKENLARFESVTFANRVGKQHGRNQGSKRPVKAYRFH